MVLCAGLHVATLFGELPEPDAALYASIARRIATSGDWINLFAYNVEWLDKPHFPFWCTALSFKLFGVGVVSARIPALLFFGLGVFATWKLALLTHSHAVARIAVLAVLTSFHLVLSNADVRAEAFLVGLLTTAVWLTVRASKAMQSNAPWLASLIGAGVFTALAMMTKGPFLALPVVCTALLPSLFRRERLFLARWALLVPIVFITLLPELIALWLQFDAHPEKVIFERTNVSGVRWFLWDSQFSRFVNDGPIRGKGDPTFFFHTVLWAFLPWGLLLYAAVGARVLELKRRVAVADPWSWAASVPMVLVFSASRFQLPHYLNVVFPFFAIIVASWLVSVRERLQLVSLMQTIVLLGGSAAMTWLVWTFAVPHALLFFALLLVGAVVIAGVFFAPQVDRIVIRSVLGAVLIVSVFQFVYLPAALRFQVGGEVARVANQLPPMRTVMLELSSHAFAFELHESVMWWTETDFRNELPKGPIRVLAQQSRLDALRAEGVSLTSRGTFRSFHASKPTLTFIDASRRESVLEIWELAEAQQPQPQK
ncbi:MAG: glycosyltransferase family 39 protein [Archangium sp.]|nr:glycosyltransferase family 39 protein [Archangium sp.]